MDLPKYTATFINNMSQFAQSTRPKNVGQLSDLLQEYREHDDNPSVGGWEKFYYEKVGKEKIDVAAKKTWDKIQQAKENIEKLTFKDVEEWIRNLIINKTFSGLQIQRDILEMISETGEWRLATPEEESKGIDGVVDGKFISIKPYSYKSTIAQTKEKIKYPIVFYKQTKRGLIIYE